MITIPHPSGSQLLAFNQGELDDIVLGVVSEHLEVCTSCCGRLEELSKNDHVVSWLQQLANSEATLLGNKLSPVATMEWPGQETPGNSEDTIGFPPSSYTRTPVPCIPGYAIECELGRGGMGVVYKAWQITLNRPVAIKMILGGKYTDAVAQARFLMEAEVIARIRHPHVVQVFEFGRFDDQPFFVLEYVDGGSLAKKLAAGRLTPRAAAEMVAKLADAIAAAHAQGVVHRDLKPANVLLTEAGEPKVTDFGLAKFGDSWATATGAVVGTPSYMAPEQAAGKTKEVGPLADVYSLGAILYELLVGRPPFVGDTMIDTILQVLTKEPIRPKLLVPELPRDLETIDLKCLQKDPGKRYKSASELADELGRYLRFEPIKARPTSSFERLLMWSRRKPAQAIAVAVSVLAGFVLLIGGALFTNELRKERNAAQLARDDTGKALLQANKELSRFETMQYVDHIVAANKAVREFDLPSAQSHLDASRPDLRNIEYDYVSKQLSQQSSELPGHTDRVSCVALSADGKRLCSGSLDKTINVLDVEEGKVLFTLQHQDGVGSLALSSDDRCLYSAGGDKIKVWDLEEGKELFTLRGNGYSFRHLALSPDGKRLYSGCSDKTVKVWDLVARKDIHTLPGQSTGVTSLALSADGKRLYAGGGENNATIKVWDTLTLKELPTLPGHPQRGVTSLAVSADGKRLYSGSYDSTVKVWDLEANKELYTLHGHLAGVVSLMLSADGKQLFSADGYWIKIWSLEPGRDDLTLHGHSSVTSMAASRDGKRLFSGSGDKTLKVWHLEPGKDSRIMGRHKGHVGLLAMSADGRRLVSAGTSSGDSDIKVWDPETGTDVATLRNQHGVRSMVLSADSKRLYMGKADYAIQVWNLEANKEIHTLRGHTGAVNFLVLSADGKRLVSGSADKTIKMWDLENGNELFTLSGHGDEVLILALSPDGKRLFSGSADKTIKVWDLEVGKEICTLGGHDTVISSLVVSPNGKRLYSAGGNQAIRSWDLETGHEVLTLAHQSGVFNMALSPDGKRLFSAGQDKTIKLWDLEVGRDILTLRGHFEWVTSLALSPDGKRLYSGSGDQTLRSWDLGDRQRMDDPALDEATRATLRQQALNHQKTELSVLGKLLASGQPQARLNIVRALSYWQDNRDLVGIRDAAALAKLPADERAACSQLWADVATLLLKAEESAENAERLVIAQIAYDRKHFDSATRHWATALASDPKLGDDPKTQHRYNAACSAALAAAGQSKGEPLLDDMAKAKLRRQALEWLKTELVVWDKILDSGQPQARTFTIQTLSHWQKDTDLASIRDSAALAKLPADEQKVFTRIWVDVAALLKKSEAPMPKAPSSLD